MNSPTARRTIFFFQVFALALLAGAFWSLRSECLWSASNQLTCLSGLAGPVSAIEKAVRAQFQWGLPFQLYTYSLYAAFGALGFITILLLVTRSLPLWGFFYLGTLALACGGEFFALRSEVSLGIRFHLAAALTAFVAFALLWKRNRSALSSRWIDPVAEGSHTPWLGEILVVTIIFVSIALTRFYQLNTNPPAWDTESCGHRIVAASWPLMIQQELELLSQQSSGMSWTALHNLFTRVDHPLLFDLDQRLLGVGISLVCCWAVYFFMRYLRGPFAAMFALVIYGFGPLDLQWSRLPTLHHLPVGVGILLAWASFAAFSKRTWGSFGAVALLIVVTKFVYPSAKLIALGPLMGMCGALVWENRAWIGHRRKFVLVVAGLALFALIRSFIYGLYFDEFRLIPPFAQIQPLQEGPSFIGSLLNVWKQLLTFLRALYFGPVIPEHYTMHVTPQPGRAIPSLGVLFMTLAFVHPLFMIRKPFALICIGLIVGGLVPALITGMEERRVSFSLVFVSFLAVLEFLWCVDTLFSPKFPRIGKLLKGTVFVVTAVFLWFYQTQAFFSRPAARPTQHLFNESLRDYVAPDTLIINLSPEHDCSIFYGVYDLVRDSGGRIAYTPAYETRAGEDPIVKPTITTSTWHYRYTDLAQQVPSVVSREDWPRKLYVLVGNANREDVKVRLRSQYPAGREIVIEGPGIPPLIAVLFETAPPSR